MLSITELFRTPWGLGVRATRAIEAGEVVWLEDPHARDRRLVVARDYPHLACSEVVQARMKRFGFELENGDLAVSGWLTPFILGETDELPLDGRPDNGEFFNHCCDPNCWWQDDFTLVARRAIAQVGTRGRPCAKIATFAPSLLLPCPPRPPAWAAGAPRAAFPHPPCPLRAA